MANVKNPLEMDYVYTSKDTGEYLHARVSIMIGNDMAAITVMPDHTLTPLDLDIVLRGVESDMLKKIRMNLLDDCRVVLKQNGQTYNVVLAEDEHCRVKGLNLHE